MKKLAAFIFALIILTGCAGLQFKAPSQPPEPAIEDLQRQAQGAGTTKIRAFTALTGGGTGALDKISVSVLADGDLGIVIASGVAYFYTFDGSATDAESSPSFIRPDDYSTSGVWYLASVGAVSTDITPSATPGWTFEDSDADAVGTGDIYVDALTAGQDSSLRIYVDDSAGEKTLYVTIDGVTEKVTFAKATNLAADSIDAITEIAAALKTGSDAKLTTGTAGTDTYTAVWNADGDLVDGYDPAGKADTDQKLDDFGTPDDNTDLDVSTSAHGLAPKLSNDAATWLDGTGSYSAPTASEVGAEADDSDDFDPDRLNGDTDDNDGIDNIVIGAGTPAAGNFTTVTATGVITGLVNVSADPANITNFNGTYTVSAAGSTGLPLPTAVAGYSACIRQGQGRTDALSATPSAGDYIVKDGVRGTIATAITSGGDATDKACFVAVNDTDWYMDYTGTWGE